MARTLPWNITRAALRAATVRDTLNALVDKRAFDTSVLIDDFHGPVLDANKWTVGNGGGASAASAVVSAGLINGAVILVTGTAGDSTSQSILTSGRHFRGDSNAVMLARLKVSAITTVKIEVGFRALITTAALVNVKATPTFTGTEGCCWIFDTNDTGRGWDGLGVAASTGATRMTSYNVSPVADTYEYLQVALQDGVAYYSHFDVDGKRDFGPVSQAAAVTKTVLQAPYVLVEARDANSKTLTVDLICAYQGRTTA